MFWKKKQKDPLFIRVLQRASDRGSVGFTAGELKKAVTDDEEEWVWVQRMMLGEINGDPPLIFHLGGHHAGDGEYKYFLTGSGASALMDYLELKEARESSRKALCFASVSALIGGAALGVSMYTANLTKDALELSADAVVSINLNEEKMANSTDEVNIARGHFPTENSTLELVLTNNSISSIEDVDIRMTLWQYYVDENTHHLTVCPFGYVDHSANPNFVVNRLNETNLFNETFSLRNGEKYPFNFDYGAIKIDKIKLEPPDSYILLRIEVDYEKSVDQTQHNFVKLYFLHLSGEYAVDIEKSPDFPLALNDKKNEMISPDGTRFPSAVYPFREEEFLQYFEGHISSLDLQPWGCRDFVLQKEQKSIIY